MERFVVSSEIKQRERVICPYCGNKYYPSRVFGRTQLPLSRDSYDQSIFECERCGRRFIGKRRVTVTYSSIPISTECCRIAGRVMK